MEDPRGIRVRPGKYRIPDICVVTGAEPREQVFTTAPFLCVEVRSKDDTIPGLEARIEEYLAFGTRFAWLVDPLDRRAWIYTPEGKREAAVLATSGPAIAIPLAEVLPRPLS